MREFRKFTRISQAQFARELDISSALLGSYEHGRAPLRFWIFERLATVFHMSAHWLATEQGPMLARYTFTWTPDKAGETELFSAAYDAQLAGMPGTMQHFKSAKELRDFLHKEISGMVSDWLDVVPDSRLNEFEKWLSSTGDEAIRAMTGRRLMPRLPQNVARKGGRSPSDK